jgi:hypothetical protein
MSAVICDQVKCGDCGGASFRVDHLRAAAEPRLGGHGSDGTGFGLVLTCEACKEKTKITIAFPLHPKFLSDGHACGGWS